MQIFVLSGETITTSFSYDGWQDAFTGICESSICGDITWKYVVYNTTMEIEDVMEYRSTNRFVTTDDQTNKVVTLSYSTDENELAHSSSNYRVKIVGSLDCTSVCKNQDGAWVCLEDCLDVIWTSFKMNIVNVCVMPSPCSYTSIVGNDAYLMNDMTAYVDNIEIKQTFTRWSDKVTGLGCESVNGQCQVLVYYLVYKSDDPYINNSEVPMDLAVIDSGAEPPVIKVKTKNYDYCGTHTVRIQGTFIYKGSEIDNKYGDEFNIFIDCCNTRSCIYTQLIPHDDAGSTAPADYAIGVDNV